MAARRIVVVTGANKGIGLEIVRRLCRDHAARFDDVILTARNEELGRRAVEDLAKDPDVAKRPLFHQLDITDEASVERLRDYLSREFGGLDVLINNAGMAFKVAATDSFEVQARVSVDTNYYGTKRVTEALLSLMRPGGRIVNVSSLASYLSRLESPELRERFVKAGLTVEDVSQLMEEFVADVKSGTHKAKGWGNSAYSVSKMGVTGLTVALAAQNKPENVLIVACCPGWCRTDMAGPSAPHSAAEGADTPVWLATEAGLAAQVHGKLVKERTVKSWLTGSNQ